MGRRGRDHMVIGFTTTMLCLPITTKYVSLNPVNWRGGLDTTLCDKVL
jgi:hypothetical protein